MTASVRISIVALALSLAAALVAVTVVGGRANAATLRTLRIPAAAFEPDAHAVEYSNFGGWLLNSGVSIDRFVAPVHLEGNTATVHSVTMHYYDSGPGNVCVELHRYRPKAGISTKTMSKTCSRGESSDYRNRIDATIKPDSVNTVEATYLTVDLWPRDSGSGHFYRLLGVAIVYTSDT